MSGDAIALATVIVAPALLLLGLLVVIVVILVGLAEADEAEGRLVRPRPADPRS